MILAYEPSAAMRRELQDYDTLWQAQTIGYDALVMITGQRKSRGFAESGPGSRYLCGENYELEAGRRAGPAD